MALYNLDFLDIGSFWLPPTEKERILKYNKNRELFSRTKRVGNNDSIHGSSIALNYYKILALTIADLAVGNEPPVFKTDKEDTFNSIKRTTNLNNKLYKSFVDSVRYGDSVFKIRYDKKLHIDVVDPSIYFKVVNEDNTEETLYHVIAYEFKIGKESYLRVEIQGYEDGYYIENRLYKLHGGRIKSRLDLGSMVRFDGVEEMVYTGLDNFTIFTTTTSASGEIYGDDDYEVAHSIIKALEDTLNQINYVLKKNSDPTMMGPSSIAEPIRETKVTPAQANLLGVDVNKEDVEGTVTENIKNKDPRGNLILLDKDDRDLEYVTYDANLSAAFTNFDTLMKSLYLVTEMSPALWGEVHEGYANSGVALKRLLIPTLSKINRLRLLNEGVFEDLIVTASKVLSNYETGYEEIEDVHIKWFDGLPDDDKERAEINKIRLESGQASIREIKAEEGYEDSMLDDIVEEIEKGLAALKGKVVTQ